MAPRTGPRLDQSLLLQLPVRLLHRVGIHRQHCGEDPPGRQLVPILYSARRKPLLHMADHLQVDGHPIYTMEILK